MSDTSKKAEHPVYQALSKLGHALAMGEYQMQELDQANREIEQCKHGLTHVLEELPKEELAWLIGREIDVMDYVVRIDDEDLSIIVEPCIPRISAFDLSAAIPSNDEPQEI